MDLDLEIRLLNFYITNHIKKNIDFDAINYTILFFNTQQWLDQNIPSVWINTIIRKFTNIKNGIAIISTNSIIINDQIINANENNIITTDQIINLITLPNKFSTIEQIDDTIFKIIYDD